MNEGWKKFTNSRIAAYALETPIADCPAHDSAILLLYPSLVAFAIGTAAGERDPDLLAIIPNGLVHEHAVVVCVQPEQGEGQQLA